MASIVKRGKSFRVRWVDFDGSRKSASFTLQREALEFSRRKEVEIDEIKLGIKAPIDHKKSVDDALNYWLENRAPNKRSHTDDISIIKVHLRPAFGKLFLRQVSIIHSDRYILDKLSKLSYKTISNHLTLLISVLNTAVNLGWLEKCPPLKKPKVSLFADDYNFLRTDEEIERFLISALSESKPVYLFYKTAICTGLRAGEMAGLKVEDLDFKNRIIRLQRSYSGPTKSGKVRYVPIMDTLFDELLEWTNKIKSGIVFPNLADQMHQPSARIYQEILHRVLDNAKLEDRIIKGKVKPYIVFHDLRHTFASHWAMKGGDMFKLQKILGHQSIAMTMRYAHLCPNAFNDDLNRFNFGSINSNTNVIPFRKHSSREF